MAFPNDGFGGDYTFNNTSDDPYNYGVPGMHSLGASPAGMRNEYPSSSRGVELQPWETCPKNYVIFDRTDNRSRIMYHPSMAHNFGSPNPHVGNYGNEQLSYIKEETEDINALLSSGGEEEDVDDDVVSTGRTPSNWRGISPDSSCARSGKQKSSSAYQSSNTASCSERKREKTKKMVKALRGIIPGGKKMDTPAVLDEAVRYLKSLKMEAKKLGMQNSDD